MLVYYVIDIHKYIGLHVIASHKYAGILLLPPISMLVYCVIASHKYAGILLLPPISMLVYCVIVSHKYARVLYYCLPQVCWCTVLLPPTDVFASPNFYSSLLIRFAKIAIGTANGKTGTNVASWFTFDVHPLRTTCQPTGQAPQYVKIYSINLLFTIGYHQLI